MHQEQKTDLKVEDLEHENQENGEEPLPRELHQLLHPFSSVTTAGDTTQDFEDREFDILLDDLVDGMKKETDGTQESAVPPKLSRPFK